MNDESHEPPQQADLQPDQEPSVKPYKAKQIWMRGLYMLIFMFLLGIAKFVAFIVIFFQFLLVLFTTQTNKRLLELGQDLSTYQYQILLFLTYNSEVHPYPMGEWPKGAPRPDNTPLNDDQ